MSTSVAEMPFVSVIVPCFHDWAGVALCLSSLELQDYPQECFEILVVNNDPSDRQPGSMRLPANCRLLVEAKPGSYAARNKALEVAKGAILAFTDADCQPLPEWISNAVEIFLADGGVSRIGGAVEVFCREGMMHDAAFPYEKLFALEQIEFVRRGAAITANMFARKFVFDQVGPFDMTLKSGGDTEWGFRAQRQGHPIIFSDRVKVRHPARTFRELRLKNRRIAGGALELAKKKGCISVLLLFLTTLAPPIFAMRRAYDAPDLNAVEKFNAVWVRIVLRYFAIFELLKLLMGKQSERR